MINFNLKYILLFILVLISFADEFVDFNFSDLDVLDELIVPCADVVT